MALHGQSLPQNQANPTGHTGTQNILREIPGPTAHAQRNIVNGSLMSSFMLIIDQRLMRHIQQATEEEAHRKLGNEAWSMTVEELNAFIGILYARGSYGANNQAIKDLWNGNWGPPFFRRVMSRNRFCEIMEYLCFDIRSTRSARLQTDEFALASHVWNNFITNSQRCYKPGENITIHE